jgi:hypothetical protein
MMQVLRGVERPGGCHRRDGPCELRPDRDPGRERLDGQLPGHGTPAPVLVITMLATTILPGFAAWPQVAAFAGMFFGSEGWE